jgi:hypothetical protein
MTYKLWHTVFFCVNSVWAESKGIGAVAAGVCIALRFRLYQNLVALSQQGFLKN